MCWREHAPRAFSVARWKVHVRVKPDDGMTVPTTRAERPTQLHRSTTPHSKLTDFSIKMTCFRLKHNYIMRFGLECLNGLFVIQHFPSIDTRDIPSVTKRVP